MKTASIAFALMFAGLLGSGCLSGGSASSADAPVLEPGFAYAFTETGRYEFGQAVNGRTHTEEGTYGPNLRVFEVLNTTLYAEDEPVYLVGYSVTEKTEKVEEPVGEGAEVGGGGGLQPSTMPIPLPVSNVQFQALRQRDLNEVPAWLNVRMDCEVSGQCTTTVMNLEFGGAPEWTLLDFPLSKGKTWSARMSEPAGDEFPDELEIEMTAKVVGSRTIDVPVGRFDAIQIDYRFEPQDLDAYEQQVRQDAEDDGARLDRFDLDFARKGTLYYSPDHMMIVKSSYESSFSVHVKGTEPDGEKFDFNMRGHQSGGQVLEGALLIPRVERDLDYLARLYTGKVAINDPTGQTIQPIGYTIRVTGAKTVVNAAEPEAVPFTAVLEGAERLPDGHKVRWSITDGFGEQVATGEGLGFSYSFDQPGEYAVDAVAVNGAGEATSADGVIVAANYEKKVAVDCPPVAMEPQLSGCTSIPVPVRAGIRFLEVTAQVASPVGAAPLVNAGQLRLREIDRKEHRDASRANNQYSIQLHEFYGSTIERTADWILQLYQTRGVLEDVTYGVSLNYEAARLFEIPAPPGQEYASPARPFGFGYGAPSSQS